MLSALFSIGVVGVLLVINGYFVALEFALVQIRKSRIDTLISEGVLSAKKCKKIKENLNSYLSATQLGITLVGLLLGILGEPIFSELINSSLEGLGLTFKLSHSLSMLVSLCFLTLLEVVLGELVPKSFALSKTERCCLLLSGSLILFYKITFPAIWLFDKLTGVCLKPWGLSADVQEEETYTKDELELLMVQSKLVNDSDKHLLGNAFKFEDCKARDVMVHRKKMLCIDKDASKEEVLDVISNNGFTRYPIISDDKDSVLGYVHVRDIYRELVANKDFNFSGVFREVPSFLECTPIQDVFKTLKAQKEQFCIIIDEYGGTSGLLTLEDIIEELVGEIHDEFDEQNFVAN